MVTTELQSLALDITAAANILSHSQPASNLAASSKDAAVSHGNTQSDAARNTLITSMRQLERLVLGPKDTLQQMYFKAAETGVVAALCSLKVPHNVPRNGSISYDELATKLGYDQDRLTHLIRNAITCSGFLCETADGRVMHSSLSSIWYLDPIMAAGNEVIMENLPLAAFSIANTFQRDPMDVDDKLCPFSISRGIPLFQWFEQNPEQGRKFAAHMRAQSSKHGDEAVRAGYDWAALAGKTLVDCGGSFGSVGAAILAASPSMKVIVQDLPKVIESAIAARPNSNPPLPESLTFAAHSFVEPQPTRADVYLYRMVFHNWSDKGACRILEALKPALRPGVKVILIEYVMPEIGSAPDYAELQTRRLDNMMYALMNGKVRELREFKALFRKVEPRLQFRSYKPGLYQATHDPRSHSVMEWEMSEAPLSAVNGSNIPLDASH